MPHSIVPLPFDPARLRGLSERLIVSHHENNYGGAVKNLNMPHANIDPAKSSIDPKKIEAILGAKGDLNAGVYEVTFGRTTKMHGHDMGNAMGVNSWAAFAGSDDQAVVDGDFAILETELQGVLKALRGAGINIVAIHQHMAGESPRILFLHFCGVDRTDKLAKGIRAAIDTQK